MKYLISNTLAFIWRYLDPLLAIIILFIASIIMAFHETYNINTILSLLIASLTLFVVSIYRDRFNSDILSNTLKRIEGSIKRIYTMTSIDDVFSPFDDGDITSLLDRANEYKLCALAPVSFIRNNENKLKGIITRGGIIKLLLVDLSDTTGCGYQSAKLRTMSGNAAEIIITKPIVPFNKI